MSNVVRKEMYVKSDVTNNNNKFWEITIFDNSECHMRWGRVGDDGQSQIKSFGSLSEAERFADGKIKEKTRDGRNGEIAYRKIDVVGGVTSSNRQASQPINNSNLSQIAAKQIKTNNPIVDDLVKYLTRVNAHQICSASGGKITFSDTTGLFSTPLGIVTQANIDQANKILDEIGDLVVTKDYLNKKMIPLTNNYLMLVPSDIGRKQLDVTQFWSDTSKLQYQKGILDGLQASYASAISLNKKSDSKIDIPEEKVFDLQLFLLDDSKMMKDIEYQYESSKKRMHVSYDYRIKSIYSVFIKEERERFEKRGKSVGNIMRLFHGSSSQNLLSIMRQGLIVPPASSPHVCGRMFSNGAYFATSSSKSLNYSLGVWGQKTADRVFMFLADVAMGKYYVPKGTYDGPFPKPGYNSVFAKANISGVQNDECIVYDISQCSLTYLLELAK